MAVIDAVVRLGMGMAYVVAVENVKAVLWLLMFTYVSPRSIPREECRCCSEVSKHVKKFRSLFPMSCFWISSFGWQA